jgi:hypothetical protein
MYERFRVKYYFSCYILMELDFSGQIFELYSILNIVAVHRVGAELFHADRQMDRHDEAMHLKVVTHVVDTRVIIYRTVTYTLSEICQWEVLV